ncbi:hypothetical protein GCM10027072_30460 [Streptomyces bullii]
MLMLQPPGRGSTYRYVLPSVAGRKREVDVMPPIRRMRVRLDRCMWGGPAGGCGAFGAARADSGRPDPSRGGPVGIGGGPIRLGGRSVGIGGGPIRLGVAGESGRLGQTVTFRSYGILRTCRTAPARPVR